jgi:hypothetical protein
MAANFTALKAEIADHLNRTDLTSVIPSLITLAEAELNNQLRSREQVGRATATLDSEYEWVPSDLIEMRRLVLLTSASPNRTLRQMSPTNIIREYPGTGTGTPKAYAVIGPQMQFRPAPDSGSTYEIEMTYYAKVTPLTSSQETASTLTAYPALYLQACLTEAYLYLHDQQGAARHLPLRDRLIEQTNTATENHQYSAGPLTINHGMRGIEGAFR